MEKLKKIFNKLRGAFSKLNELRKELKYEVSLLWKNEKNEILYLFGLLGFIIFVVGMLLFAFIYTETFFTISFTILGVSLIFVVEVNFERYSQTQYPLLRKIKHGLIRLIAYPIILFLIGLLWYALLF